MPFNKIRLTTERRYLDKGLIPHPGLAVIWGPPKSGKSFWTFDLVMHVALDREYRGRRVKSGPVVYCCFEGQSGIQTRIEAFRQRFLPVDARGEYRSRTLVADGVGVSLERNSHKTGSSVGLSPA